MTSKERMLLALNREKPDRLPVTIHQWQKYHLDKYMGAIEPLEAFKICGLDASIQYFEAMGQLWIPNAEKYITQTSQWHDEIEVIDSNPDNKILKHTVNTPEGTLTYTTGGNLYTTWIKEYMVKKHEDIELIDKYMPVGTLNKDNIAKEYDRIGDAGILRGFVWGDQAGCWQHACCLMDVNELMLEAMDNPAWVHRFMTIFLVMTRHP